MPRAKDLHGLMLAFESVVFLFFKEIKRLLGFPRFLCAIEEKGREGEREREREREGERKKDRKRESTRERERERERDWGGGGSKM